MYYYTVREDGITNQIKSVQQAPDNMVHGSYADFN
jgi:hypothetical protein